MKQYCFLFLITVFAGCVKTERLTDRDKLKIKIHKARLSDIPIPLGAKSVIKKVSDNSFGYTLESESIDLFHYYQLEMEHYGWRLIGKFNSVEQQLIFEKPHKIVSIAIRKQDKIYVITILTSDK